MKRTDVLHLTITIIGVVTGIYGLQYLFISLLALFGSLFISSYDQSDMLLTNLSVILGIGIQLFICWLLVVKSSGFAAFLYKKSGLKRGIIISNKPNDLLQILLTVIGIYLLVTNLSPFLRNIFESFKSKGSSGILNLYNDERPVEWAPLILDIILPLALLMFAKPIADYFSKNLSDENITLEEEEVVEDKNKLTELNED